MFVLAIGVSFINANSSNDEFLPITNEVIDVVEDFGCARDCVDRTLDLFEDSTVDLPQQETVMALYLMQYEKCFKF
ncbi:hypothetical protein [Polaribacter sp. Asnod6-C07]|uniref:hypothetical protein n=1 Tax=Polaribacter sp. Asnod6-C07 TaxID=3160582 RepID=UPI0038675328